MFSQLEQHRSGGYLQAAATIVAVAISALASFQFFATYSGGLLAGLVPPDFLAIAAGLIGVTLLEGGTIYWQRSLQHDADSQQQVTIARAAYMVSMVLSVGVTMLYFLLTSSLIAPYVASVQHIINGLAALVIIGATGFQFVAKLSYSGAATTSVEARQRAELAALANMARFNVERESTRADLEQAIANIERALPDASRRRGRQDAGEYIAARYGPGQGNGAGGFRLVDIAEDTQRPTPRPNGRG